MDAYILIDFGSTFTKVTIVDVENETILATEKAITTVGTNIVDGFKKAYSICLTKINEKKLNIVRRIACSSAAGGLKMIAVGFVPELTAEAAKRAALGAGARIIKVYSSKLTENEVIEIKNNNIDIILLAGGTDGGDKECIVHNAGILSEYRLTQPIVVAGNKDAADEIKKTFSYKKLTYRVTDNVMPDLNVINAEPAREVIRQIFMENIVRAKGLKDVNAYIDGIMMPTPAAVLKAATLLSLGNRKEEGIGELLVIDVGGATTDVHSVCVGDPSVPGIVLKGLPEPLAKRTVEGDLGMRYSALALLEAVGSDIIARQLKISDNEIYRFCQERVDNTAMLPDSEPEQNFDTVLAKAAVSSAMERHAGTLENIYSPIGNISVQNGKDLLGVKNVLGTGGVIVESSDPKFILSEASYNPEIPTRLKPENPQFLLDQNYILSAMGLLASCEPDIALRILKKNITAC